MSFEKDITEIRKVIEAGGLFKPASPEQIASRPDPGWARKSDDEVNSEFSSVAEDVIGQGELDILLDMIPVQSKRDFLIGYHEEN